MLVNRFESLPAESGSLNFAQHAPPHSEEDIKDSLLTPRLAHNNLVGRHGNLPGQFDPKPNEKDMRRIGP